jgi:hypothetical protein
MISSTRKAIITLNGIRLRKSFSTVRWSGELPVRKGRTRVRNCRSGSSISWKKKSDGRLGMTTP